MFAKQQNKKNDLNEGQKYFFPVQGNNEGIVSWQKPFKIDSKEFETPYSNNQNRARLSFRLSKDKKLKFIKKDGNFKKQKQLKIAMKQKIILLEEKVKNLQEQLKLVKLQQNQNNYVSLLQPEMFQTPKKITETTPSDQHQNESQVEFEKIDFTTMLSVATNPDIDNKSWVFLGTLMIVMGSQSIDYDVKEAADQIRRQVEKSQDKINLDFYMLKQQIGQPSDVFNLDPFLQSYQEPKIGFQLEAIRLQSIQQSQLFFTQKISYTVKYESLIKGLQYIKANSWFSRQFC